jgi:hypothetical protein
MPEVSSVDRVAVEEAAQSFYADFKLLQAFHAELGRLMAYYGKAPSFDQRQREIVQRQTDLMFELRNLFVEAYDLLPPEKQSEVFNWIVKATGELKVYRNALDRLGLPFVIVAGGVVLSALTAGALVVWHKSIQTQAKAIELQKTLVPLVVEGKLPADVLKPAPASGIGGLLQAIPGVVIAAAVVLLLPRLIGGGKE